MRKAAAVVRDAEDWLVDRVLDHAAVRGYTDTTSTLREAWRASVHGLSMSLIEAMEAGTAIPELHPGLDPTSDPLARYGIEQAKRHRVRGVPLTDFLGLLKYYRQSYVELARERLPGDAVRERALLFIDRFFDHVELGLVAEWAAQPPAPQLGATQAEARRLANEKNKYLTIFESLNEPVVVLDEDGGLENLNHAAASIFAGIATPGSHYYSPQSVHWLDPEFERLLADSHLVGISEWRLLTVTGPRWYEVKVDEMLDVSRKFGGRVFVFTDVTERKQAGEELEQLVESRTADLERLVGELERSNAELERFAYIASHDLQEPLRTVASFTQLLQRRYRGRLDAEADEFIDFAVGGARRMSALIQDLLTYSRLRTAAEPLRPVQAGQALDWALQSLGTAIAEAGAEISVDPLPELTADPTQLSQLFLNLVANAVKFRRPGVPAKVHVGATEADTHWRLWVADNGIGIDPDYRDIVFDAFRRLHTQDEYAGTGIGLALCKRIVERHGGRIWIEAEEGGGSRFSFDWPKRPPSDRWTHSRPSE